MNKNYPNQLIALLILLVCSAQISFATDGYFSIGYGTKSKGMAGAGVALFSNSLIGGCMYSNQSELFGVECERHFLDFSRINYFF